MALEQERCGWRGFSKCSGWSRRKGNRMRNRWLKSLVPALALATLPVLPAVSQAGIAVGVSITVAPPVLPVYVQPPLPAPGYIWTPGYWAYGDDGYYWVPGTWVLPPQPGFLWTPGYWGWVDGAYLWHGGYWGPHVGFYGGVNYGCGYTGVGFQGGYWHGGAFFYNRSVMNVGSVHVTNVYNRTVINNNFNNRVAFNGGPGGLGVRPTRNEMMAEREHHFEPTSMQREHVHMAQSNPQMRASFNHGRPAVAATPRPGEFSGRGVVAARGVSGPHGGPVGGPHPGGPGPVVHNTAPMNHGPENRSFENHAGPTPRGGAPAPRGPSGAAPQFAHNEPSHVGGGAPRPGNFGGGGVPHSPPAQHFCPPAQQHFNQPAQHFSPPPQQHFSAPAPHPAGNFGGGRPPAGGAPRPPQNNGGGGHRPEGHR
jgi:hypothetical protein